MREYTGSIRAMCRMTGENISPYFFPFLLGDYIVATGLSKILILLIFIIIVCNVFCKQEEIYYYAIRTGYRAMVYGDIHRNPGSGILYVCLFMQYIVFPSICNNTR